MASTITIEYPRWPLENKKPSLFMNSQYEPFTKIFKPDDFVSPRPTKEQQERMMDHNFYYNWKSNIDDRDALGFEARKAACKVSKYVVGVSCKTPEYYSPLFCSGVLVDFLGNSKVLTSAYVLGDHAGDSQFSFPIKVYLPDNVTVVDGSLSYLDRKYNLAVIHLQTDDRLLTAPLAPMTTKLDQNVVAVGRFCRGGEKPFLVASHGKVCGRKDNLECDDALASSCSTTEWGIGGPLVDTLGNFAGMNFYGGANPTPFLPITLLMSCLDQFKSHGRIIRPALGIKIKSLSELTLKELEAVGLKFSTLDGVLVKEVEKGSVAEKAGISVGDVIIECNNTKVIYPVQVTVELFCVERTPLKRKHGASTSITSSRIKLILHRKNTGSKETIMLDFPSASTSADDISCWSVRAV